MAKKKKSQLKPVARGFATTSVAKKVVPAEIPSEVAEEEKEEGQDTDTQQNAGPSADANAAVDPAKVEDQAMQSFVDKFQDRIEKEVVRTIKGIEQEQRFSLKLPSLAVDSFFVDEIIKLALTESEATAKDDRPLEEAEEKILPRLAITYGVLRRTGFSEDLVETCLRSIHGVELSEALEWLYLHHSDDELFPTQALLETGQVTPVSTITPTPSSQDFQQEPTERASTKTPITKSLSPNDASSDKLFDAEASALLQELVLPDDDLTASYVKLKVQIAELTTHRSPAENRDSRFISVLQKRLEEIKNDYFFEAAEAEAAWLNARENLDASVLNARLRGTPTIPTRPEKAKKVNVTTPKVAQDSNSTDVFDNNSDEDTPGGLFELLQEMPKNEVTASGTTIQVRDLPAPKHWSGRTPRTLLEETVRKIDRLALVEFRIISGSSRAKRATVRILWRGGKVNDWMMDDVACYDEGQAQQYIAMVAIHALTFPPTDGFAVGGTAAANSNTSIRLLAPVYRDIWNEFEEKRRQADDAINRKIWAKLKSMLDPRLSTEKTSFTAGKKTAIVNESARTRPSVSNDSQSGQLFSIFQGLLSNPAYYEMLQQRNLLPIASYRPDIIDALERSQVIILSGETGCGKSTQLPAFILEDHLSRGKHCKIYCTEPRRISAVSLAQRVSQELGEPAGAVGTLGSLVGYSIRLESNTSKTTRLVYVTNGIALRMLESGSGKGGRGTAFDEITHIIIDEVHERSIESDFLLIVLRSLLAERPDLKVVLMSATLDAERLSKYFGGCPILLVPGRTFPVEVQYLEDAVEFTQWKVAEGSPYAVWGRGQQSRGKSRVDWSETTTLVEDDDDEVETLVDVRLEKRYSPTTVMTLNNLDERLVPYELIVQLLERICFQSSVYSPFSAAILVFMAGMAEIRRLHELLMEHRDFASTEQFKIYPLHSTITADQQAAVFDIPPPGVRKIVIATNIAETGITIPDITCVIDTGRHREMRFDEKRQLSRLVDTFVAKSNASQRRGRAGRVQPGLCFHLFTKHRHDTKMVDHPDPEIMRLSLSDLALRIKMMKVKLGNSIEDVLSRALDPPSSVNIQRAISALVEVRALTPTEDITTMGRLLSKLPADVHLGKFLLMAAVFRCLDPALTIVAALNSKSPFLRPFGKEEEARRERLSFRTDNSDFLTLHNAFSAWRRACMNGTAVAFKFCKDSYLSHQNLQQIEELRQQFLGYLVDSSFMQADEAFTRELSRARYSGRGRTRFIMPPAEYDRNSSSNALINAALTAGLYPKIISIETSKDVKNKLVTITNNQPVYFHPSSVNFGRKPEDLGTNYLSYFTIMQSKKMYAWETGPVDDLALVLLCGDPDFKLMSASVFLDRKVRYRIEPKASVAIKLLRSKAATLLASRLRNEGLNDMLMSWEQLIMAVLSKVKPEDPVPKLDSVTLIVNSTQR